MISHIIVLLICFIGLVEAILMALVDWEDLAISVHKSPRKLYNVLKDELGLPEWNELSVIERRSMKKRYAVIRDSFPELPPWEELSVIDRRRDSTNLSNQFMMETMMTVQAWKVHQQQSVLRRRFHWKRQSILD